MKKFLSFLFASVILSSCFAFTVVNAEETMKDEGGFFPGWGTRYRLEQPLSAVPSTFEAVVYFPAEYFTVKNGEPGIGGNIFGNYNGRGNTEYFAIEYGYPVLYWRDEMRYAGYGADDLLFTAKFDNVSIEDYAKDANGNYTTVNISVTRDFSTETVSCYINGNLVQTLNFADIVSPNSGNTQYRDYATWKKYVNGTDKRETREYVVGGDMRSLNALYFRGATSEIATINRLAVYGDVRTATEIIADYNNIGNDKSDLIAYFDFSGVESVSPATISDVTGAYTAKKSERYLASAPEKNDYVYSMAVVGDTQILMEHAANNKTDTYANILYNWIANNKESLKIGYSIGLGDITDNALQSEYTMALDAMKALDNINLPYTAIRGNHDLMDISKKGDITYEAAMSGSAYAKTVPVSQRFNGELRNSYKTINLNGTHYLILSLDYGAPDATLEWASSVLNAYPNHNVIVATHAYTGYYGDHQGFKENTSADLSYNDGWSKNDDDNNNGVEIWEKFISKHENICLVLSGHVGKDIVVMSQVEGKNGRIVTEILTDHQDVDNAAISDAENKAPMGVVTMLYFMGDGKTVTVETISTSRAAAGKPAYYGESSQFTFELDLRGTTGDVNNDGVTNLIDVIKTASECLTPTGDYGFCDQTGDGKVSLVDILRVLNITVQ